MPFNLGEYLKKQSIRMLRDNWVEDARLLSQELFTILSNIQVDTTGPISVTPPGEDPVDFPPIEDLNIPPFDFDLPEGGPNQPQIEQTPTYTRTETYFWHRAIFSGQILSQESGGSGETYNVRLHPNGSLITKSQGKFGFNTPDTPAMKEVVARVTDASLAGTVSPNAWVFVLWIVEYLLIEEVFRDNAGKEIGRQSELKVLQEEYLFNAPASGGGGKVARVTTTITGRDGTTPGQGRAILYDFTAETVDPVTGDPIDPVLVPGSEVDVYNSVIGEVEAGADKFIQVKRIDNAWFIDVEDCAAGGS